MVWCQDRFIRARRRQNISGAWGVYRLHFVGGGLLGRCIGGGKWRRIEYLLKERSVKKNLRIDRLSLDISFRMGFGAGRLFHVCFALHRLSQERILYSFSGFVISLAVNPLVLDHESGRHCGTSSLKNAGNVVRVVQDKEKTGSRQSRSPFEPCLLLTQFIIHATRSLDSIQNTSAYSMFWSRPQCMYQSIQVVSMHL